MELNVKNNLKTDVNIIINNIATFYLNILEGDTRLFMTFIQIEIKY